MDRSLDISLSVDKVNWNKESEDENLKLDKGTMRPFVSKQG